MNKNLLKKEFEYIKEYGSVSIFWINYTQARAERIDYLIKIGAIIRKMDSERDQYPWCVFDADESKLLADVPCVQTVT